jgi:hypothetical protein
MKRKLNVNADHYFSLFQKIIYIVSRLEEKTLGFIGPRVDGDGLIFNYIFTDDVFGLFPKNFADFHRAKNAVIKIFAFK